MIWTMCPVVCNTVSVPFAFSIEPAAQLFSAKCNGTHLEVNYVSVKTFKELDHCLLMVAALYYKISNILTESEKNDFDKKTIPSREKV